jgi:hypothetical protein
MVRLKPVKGVWMDCVLVARQKLHFVPDGVGVGAATWWLHALVWRSFISGAPRH